MADTETTEVQFDSMRAAADAKDDQASTLKACAASVGGAGAVALSMNPGSMAAIGAVAACGMIGAFLVGNSKAVEKNADALRATRDSFAATHEENTTAAGRLPDPPASGINARTWA